MQLVNHAATPLMRIAAVRIDGHKTFGIIDDQERFRPFLSDGHALDGLPAVIDAVRGEPRYGDPVPLEGLALEAPVGPLPKNVICVGKNYHDHAQEFERSGFDAASRGTAVPEHPIFFSKGASTIARPLQPIDASSDDTGTLDYEAELGVVIGRRTRRVARDAAMQCVFGYTLVNDVTARGLQRRHNQWFLGKNLDGFCPVGPWIVTADALPDLGKRELTATVNGERRQRTTIDLMIFDIPTIIATLSKYMTLEPGDLIATGTPAGVGAGFDPPRFLQSGDEVRIALTGLGELRNAVL
jgi:2-keto-4-pentenoate hydratase/2-oxohepta-3-ene-1,7-dioic acid hydratase in catechol pathway